MNVYIYPSMQGQYQAPFGRFNFTWRGKSEDSNMNPVRESALRRAAR